MEIISVKVGSPSQAPAVNVENPSQVNATLKNVNIQTGGTAKNAVLYDPQDLTDEQKQQARTNIGAASQDDANVTAENIKSALGYDPAKQSDVDDLSEEIADEKIRLDEYESLTLGVHTDGLFYIFKNGEPIGNGVSIQGEVVEGDVFGYVDENNVVVLEGNLADGTYTIKYEMENGNVINIGNMVLDSNVYYSVTNNLTNCVNNNNAIQAVKGGSYSATITANDGYELKSVAVTMGGSPVTVSGGTISIANVTGDIVITAVAEVAAEPTNFFVVGGDGYLNPGRAGSNGADRTDVPTCLLSNYIEVQNGDEIYAYGAHSSNGDVGLMALYKAGKTGGVGFYARSNPSQLTNVTLSDEVDIFTINYADAAYMRACFLIPSDLSTLKVNIKRNGEWL